MGRPEEATVTVESILVPIACLLLLSGFFVAIIQPILTGKRAWVRPTDLARATIELTEQKEQVYSSLRELTFDHSLGKISDADFETIRIDLEAKAVEVLRRLDGLESGEADANPAADLDARIEADLQSLESPPTPTASTQADTSQATTSQAGPAPAAKFCSTCGTARGPGHRFCAQCGAAFDPVPPA
ncbi:MAG: hypothetical protein CL726_09740 [Chloroflexi bacterium]|nr:hypothetical protein [Chloroflexota bacterium]